MELNVCLYCEKRLADDNMAFCSTNCQSKEASKSFNASYYIDINSIDSSIGFDKQTYKIAYHRSPSLTMNYKQKDVFSSSLLNTQTPYLMQSSLSSSTSFSSSVSDLSLISSNCSCEDKVRNISSPFSITRTT